MSNEDGQPAPSERRVKPAGWVWLVVGLAVVGLLAAAIILGPTVYDLLSDQDRIGAWVQALGPGGPLAIVLLQMTQVILAPIPGQAVGAISGYLYGPWLGTLYSMVGVVAGSIVAFLLARRFGRPLVVRLVSRDVVSRLDDLAARGGAIIFFVLWLFPFSPDDLVCLAAGLTPMPFGQFVVLMIVGRLSGVFLSVAAGAFAMQISPGWWLGILTVLVAGALIVWRWGAAVQEAVLRLADGLRKRVEP